MNQETYIQARVALAWRIIRLRQFCVTADQESFYPAVDKLRKTTAAYHQLKADFLWERREQRLRDTGMVHPMPWLLRPQAE